MFWFSFFSSLFFYEFFFFWVVFIQHQLQVLRRTTKKKKKKKLKSLILIRTKEVKNLAMSTSFKPKKEKSDICGDVKSLINRQSQ